MNLNSDPLSSQYVEDTEIKQVDKSELKENSNQYQIECKKKEKKIELTIPTPNIETAMSMENTEYKIPTETTDMNDSKVEKIYKTTENSKSKLKLKKKKLKNDDNIPLLKLKLKKSKRKKLKEKKPKPRKKLIPPDYEASQEVLALTETIPFYTCAACEVKYNNLNDLQKHVFTHKDRITSWDMKLKNLQLRKQLKKEQSSLKKIIKKEIIDGMEVEIKVEPPDDPEYGSIQNEIDEVTKEIGQFLEHNPQQSNGHKNPENGGSAQNSNNEQENENLSKIFKCGGCSKQFALGYYLRLHVRSHTGEKPYKCAECSQSFITASKLSRHRKRVHLSLKYECRICRKPYTRLEFLQKHFNKYHLDDKIEGEPYDYNAILPYIKDLEEELRKKKEEEERQKENAKRMEDDFLLSIGQDVKFETESKPQIKTEANEFKTEVKIEPEDSNCSNEAKFENVQAEPLLVNVEPINVNYEQYDENEAFEAPISSPVDDPISDEDYFPDDTWLPPLSPPKDPPPSPRRKKIKLKKRINENGKECVTCDICLKEFSPSYIKIHKRIHSGSKPYKCKLCSKGFVSASKLSRHVLTHDEWDDCDQQPLKPDPDGEPNCVKQETDITDDGDVPKKKRKKRTKQATVKSTGVKNPRPHSCEFCKKRFLRPESLQIHLKTHNGEHKVLMCEFCQIVFDNDTLYKEHEGSHPGPKPYLCTVCGRCYKTKESMVYHKRMHTSDQKFQCDVCPKSFNAQCKLQRHLMSHRPDKFVVRYECPVCAHIFNTKYHIEMHLTTHEKEGVIQPENRGQVIAMVMQNARKIPLETDAVVSTNMLPPDERSRICNICGEIFEHFYFLEQHLKTHGSTISIQKPVEAEEKRHICKICNKGFKLSYYLKLHSYTHTKEKPFTCQQCGKGFITKNKLKRHLETHTGLKKYQCHVCCKFFTRSSYLRIHVRTIHGTQDYNLKVDNDFDMVSFGGMAVLAHGST